MKKSILLIAAVFFAIAANAQKMNEADVPANVKASFAKLYPTIKSVKWGREKGNYEAEFDLKKVETSVMLDARGGLVATEIEIKVSELPKSVADYCAKNYAGKKINEAAKITNTNGVVTYEAEIEKKDLLFSADGKFIKEEKDSDADKD